MRIAWRLGPSYGRRKRKRVRVREVSCARAWVSTYACFCCCERIRYFLLHVTARVKSKSSLCSRHRPALPYPTLFALSSSFLYISHSTTLCESSPTSRALLTFSSEVVAGTGLSCHCAAAVPVSDFCSSQSLLHFTQNLTYGLRRCRRCYADSLNWSLPR